jgi:hypothetical protein
MTDESVKPQARSGSPAAAAPAQPAADEGHYEEVAEYRIGEGPPPLFLILAFFFIVLWACFSWIPLFGY